MTSITGTAANTTTANSSRRGLVTSEDQPRPQHRNDLAADGAMIPAVGASVHDLQELVVDDLVLAVAPPSDRTTIEIVVERDASLVLKAPQAVTIERAAQFVVAKRRWVYRKLAEKDALTGPPIIKQFVEGEGFAYLGRSYRLTLTGDGATSGARSRRRGTAGQARPGPTDDAPSPAVRLERGRFHLCANEADRGATAMRRWYTDVGGQWLRRRIRPWAARMGEDAVRVEVRDLGYRWGSARPSDGPHSASTSTGPRCNSRRASSTTSSSTNSPTSTKPTTSPSSGPPSPASCPATSSRGPTSPP